MKGEGCDEGTRRGRKRDEGGELKKNKIPLFSFAAAVPDPLHLQSTSSCRQQYVLRLCARRPAGEVSFGEGEHNLGPWISSGNVLSAVCIPSLIKQATTS